MTIVAELQTEHFQFMAIGASEPEAREKVAECFLRHLAQTFDGDRQEATENFLLVTWTEEQEKLPWVENVHEWYGIGIWDFSQHDMLRDHAAIREES
jgi:hypothetical protein